MTQHISVNFGFGIVGSALRLTQPTIYHLMPLASGRAILPVMKFDRITVDPAVCGGKPCVRGLRFPVSRLLGLLAAGETREAILKAYPYLEAADIDEALRYAGGSLD
jgi:uncharacterized protein (DUF433 family)